MPVGDPLGEKPGIENAPENCGALAFDGLANGFIDFGMCSGFKFELIFSSLNFA